MHKSPFHTIHEQLNANFGEFENWTLPADFGDIDQEKKALSESCAVVDLCSFGRVQINGKSSKEFINAFFSTKNGKVPPDSWVWAKPIGYEIESLCRIIRLNGGYTLLTSPGQTESLFHWIESKSNNGISVSDITRKTAMLGLYGPKAFDSMRGVLPFDIDHLDTGDAEKMSFMMLSFTLLRGSWLNEEGLELICPAAAGPLAAGAIAKYRHKHNITPAGMISLKKGIIEMQKSFTGI